MRVSKGQAGKEALAAAVAAVVERSEGLADLCGEILATLALPANAEFFGRFATQCPNLLASWRKRFDEITGG